MAANSPISIRLRPITVAYLDELASVGYAKDRTGVMRRFIENGVIRALERHVIEKKSATDFPTVAEHDEDDD